GEEHKKLHECADNVDKVHRDCTISNVVASSTSIASGILTILGLVLAPFTAGISLGLSATGLGLGAAAAVTGVSTSIVELVNTSSVEAQLDFHRIAQKISSGKSLYKVKDFRKHIRAIRMAKSSPQLVAGRVSGRSTQPVRAAFGGTAFAMTRRARICGGVSAGLFFPFGIWSLVKDSQDLQGRAKTESAERLREQAQKLEMNLEVLTQIYERLKKDVIALHKYLNELKGDLIEKDQETLTKEELDRRRFLKKIPRVKRQLEERIGKLHELADKLDKDHKESTIFKVMAHTTGVASGALTLLGLALAPVTGGGSLALSAAGFGLGATAAVANVSTSYKENASRSAAETEANSLMATGVKKWKVLLEVLRSNPQIVDATKKLAESIKTKIHDMETGKANPDFAPNEDDLLGSGKIIVPGTRLIKNACSVSMAPAAAAGARIVGAATAGVFLLVDVGFLVRESMHLHDGAKDESAESLRQLARKLESKLQELNKTYEHLQ
ncbi:APOL3, partial [Cervus elaphus hippelaphus]